MDQPGEELKWDPGKGSSMESNQRKSCPSETNVSALSQGKRMVFFYLRESKFPGAALPQDLRD